MTRVNLDAQHEMIRQFVLALSASPDGTVLESGGHPVACVVPPPKVVPPDGEWTDEQNRRRCELIDRKYDQGLCPSDEAELALLQDAMYRYVDKVAPLPLDNARALHQELLGKTLRVFDENKSHGDLDLLLCQGNIGLHCARAHISQQPYPAVRLYPHPSQKIPAESSKARENTKFA